MMQRHVKIGWALAIGAVWGISSPSVVSGAGATSVPARIGEAPVSGAVLGIEDVVVRPNTENNTLAVRLTVINSSSQTRKVQIRTDLSAWNRGANWNYPTIPSSTITLQGGEHRPVAFKPIPWKPGPASWWWPNVPFRPSYHAQLHQLRVSLVDTNGKVVQARSTRFGFCTVGKNGVSPTLNGVPIHLRGDRLSETELGESAFRQLPGFLPPTSTSAGWPGTVRNYQHLNMNLLRLNLGFCTPYMLNVCDELGQLVIPEIPSGFVEKAGVVKGAPDALRWIEQNGNHPGILQWNLEPSGTPEGQNETLAALIRAVHGVRPCVMEKSVSAMEGNPEPVQPGLILRGLREKDALDDRPFSVIPLWPGVISGLSPANAAAVKLASAAASGGQRLLNPAHPWEFPTIQLLQRSLSPVAAYDADFDVRNVVTNGKGEWPARQPQVPASQPVTRQVTLFNEEFDGEKLILEAQPRLRTAPDRAIALPPYRRVVVVPKGGHVTVPVTIVLPTVKENTALEVVWLVQKAGVERYRESNYYIITPSGPGGAEAAFIGRDDKTQGNWPGVYGALGFMVPRLQGRAVFQGPSVQLIRGTSMTMDVPKATRNELEGNDGIEGQQQLARFVDKLTVDDPRVQLDGPGASEREPIAFRAHGGMMFFRIDTTDGLPHRLSLYCLDYFRKQQSENLDILDLKGNRLETRLVSNYGNGAYFTFRFRGAILVRVTSQTLDDPLVSSLFVDPPGAN